MTSRRWDGDNDMSSPVAARWVATGLFRQDLSSTRVFVYELCERSIILWSLARRLTGRGATSAMYDCILTINYNSQLKQCQCSTCIRPHTLSLFEKTADDSRNLTVYVR